MARQGAEMGRFRRPSAEGIVAPARLPETAPHRINRQRPKPDRARSVPRPRSFEAAAGGARAETGAGDLPARPRPRGFRRPPAGGDAEFCRRRGYSGRPAGLLRGPIAERFKSVIRVDLVSGDETLPLRPASLDLVASVLAFQFVNDLPGGACADSPRATRPDGSLLLAAMIGGDLAHRAQASVCHGGSRV